MIHKRRSSLLFFLGASVFLFGARYIVAFPKISQPLNSNTDSLVWDVGLNRPFLKKGSNSEVLLNLKIEGQEFSSHQRAPVNLVLVIDRSGSMSESGKLEYAKDAAKNIISGLTSEDRLSVIAYSTGVQLLYPIQHLTDKERAISVIDSLYPTDSTNLSGGLIMGIDQLRSLYSSDYINRVILLSDGLANVGITSAAELGSLAGQAAEGGIHVTTMGLGLNYDENLMMNLAEHGAGNYYFIESPSQLAGIFKKEFGQMVATVAKDSVINLSLSPDVELKEIFGYTHTTKDGLVQINLGDLHSGQERNILIRLNAPTGTIGKHQLVNASLEFTDILNNSRNVKLEKKLSYQVTEDKSKVIANEDKNISARGSSVKAAYDLYQAVTEYEKGNREDALSRVKRALSGVVEINSSPQKTDDTMKQEGVLRGAMELLADEAPAPGTPSGKKIIKEYKAEAREEQK
jgi:Ca-activated chloride channel family protein